MVHSTMRNTKLNAFVILDITIYMVSEKLVFVFILLT